MAFPAGYHANTRTDLAPYLPAGGGYSVLELGCGEGRTGAWLKQTGFARRVIGVERFAAAAEAARARLDAVHHVDLDSFDYPHSEPFDVVLAADVLEHLVDPLEVLKRMMPHLRRGGWLLTSTPNVRYWPVLADLVFRGRWAYGSNVVLDPTHLRFFTGSSIQQLHAQLGLEVQRFGHLELSGKRVLLDAVTLGALRDFLCGQHVLRSVKP